MRIEEFMEKAPMLRVVADEMGLPTNTLRSILLASGWVDGDGGWVSGAKALKILRACGHDQVLVIGVASQLRFGIHRFKFSFIMSPYGAVAMREYLKTMAIKPGATG